MKTLTKICWHLIAPPSRLVWQSRFKPCLRPGYFLLQLSDCMMETCGQSYNGSTIVNYESRYLNVRILIILVDSTYPWTGPQFVWVSTNLPPSTSLEWLPQPGKRFDNFKKTSTISGLYCFIFVFSQQLTVNKCLYKNCQWLDSNQSPLELEATTVRHFKIWTNSDDNYNIKCNGW